MNCLKRINSITLITGFILISHLTFAQGTLATKTAKINFFSSTPVEDIKAVSEKGTAVLIPKNLTIAFQVPIRSFSFAKGLMQEHFNENYMESDKYPYAKFRGNIQQAIDLSKDGDYIVSAHGTLSIHGVDQLRTIPGKIYVRNGSIRLISHFDVACEDHEIKIPTLVITKVAEIIKVSVDASLNPVH